MASDFKIFLSQVLAMLLKSSLLACAVCPFIVDKLVQLTVLKNKIKVYSLGELTFQLNYSLFFLITVIFLPPGLFTSFS